MADQQEVESCLVMDCYSRAAFLGDRFNEELKVINTSVASALPGLKTEGVLALGEIASDGNRLPDMHNKTMAAALFHEL